MLGSLLSSGYRGGMEDAVTGLPASAAATAQDSLAGALAVARQRRRRDRASGSPPPPRTRSSPACTPRRSAAAAVALAGARGRPAVAARAAGARDGGARPRSSCPRERDAAQPAGPEPGPGPPGRPRSAAADVAIIRATLELLVAEGYRALTMERVRERAGVGKATVYRRYGSKAELVTAAVAHLHQELPLPADTGSLRGDFGEVAKAAVESADAAQWMTFMPRMLAEVAQEPELRDLFYAALVQPRRSVIEAVLRRAIERGEVRADVDLDLAVDLITGPMIYRIIITGGDLAEIAGRPMQVLDTVIEGLRPR